MYERVRYLRPRSVTAQRSYLANDEQMCSRRMDGNRSQLEVRERSLPDTPKQL
ncbi:UNVERIFIED_ORG: hypothetical protein ABIB21_003083 [Arthrobacter sp. UYEF13]